MAQETQGAGAESVGSRHENSYQIALLCPRHFHPVGQQIQGCAQWTHDRADLAVTAQDLVSDQDWVVLADDLAKISRSGQVMVQPTIGYQENLPPGDLP